LSQIIAAETFEIGLLISEAHDCSYIAAETARMLFVDPDTVIDVPLYSQLSRMGFRRNGNFLYTPRCVGCALCLASRVDVQRFKRNRSQRRCWTKNADVVIDQLASIDMAEHYEVYSAYIAQRHSDGDMYPPSMKQFEDYLGRPWECTSYLEMRLADQLIGCAVIDSIDHGLSATYTYFHPDFADRGLGTLAVLFQIELIRKLGLDYLYLGYWIELCEKMSYKRNFQPLEVFRDNCWRELK
jgi:arginine-tRNA-protein transferase|tara:strand:+ start:1845 stop:2567 length:723 start_codon:yes stop_codon:yes gene_type:complete